VLSHFGVILEIRAVVKQSSRKEMTQFTLSYESCEEQGKVRIDETAVLTSAR